MKMDKTEREILTKIDDITLKDNLTNSDRNLIGYLIAELVDCILIARNQEIKEILDRMKIRANECPALLDLYTISRVGMELGVYPKPKAVLSGRKK
jgi:hypothetical protein